MALNIEVAQMNSGLATIRQRHSFEQQRSDQINKRLAEIETEKTSLVKAVALIDRSIATISANGIGKIESIVTGGMRLAFNDPTLAMNIVKKDGARGTIYALEGVRGEVRGPFMETFGGGIWNVVGFLLRVILIKRFKLAKVLVVDEAFNNVAPVYQPMLSTLLRDLAKNHGYTILAVTHQPILAAAADNIYQVVPTTDEPPILRKIPQEELDESLLFHLLRDR